MSDQKLYRISLLFILFVSLFANLSLSAEREKYLYFTDIDGLPRNITTCLEQDDYGYLWIGTGNGIARYDGNTFLTYSQFSGMGITCLLIDSKNNLWVGTSIGLYSLNRLTNYFEQKANGFIQRIQEDRGQIYFLQVSGIQKLFSSGIVDVKSKKDIVDFCISEEGIWCSNNHDGVKLISRKSGFRDETESLLPGKNVSIVSQINDQLFLGCRNGQLFVRTKNGSVKQIPLENHHNFKKITKVNDEIWMATDGNGIQVLDAGLKFSRSINKNFNLQTSISSNSIYDIYPGRNHEIWIASYGAGLTCILPDNLLLKNIGPENGNVNSLVSNEGVAIFKQKDTFYFGTNYGLSVWNEKTDRYTNFQMDELRKNLKGVKVLAIATDKNNNLWVGTNDGLLGKYDSGNRFIKAIHPSSNNPEEMQQIVLMHNYQNTNLLIGTQYQDRCLLNFNLETEAISPFEMYSKGSQKTQFQINSIRENQQGELIALISNLGLFTVNVKENVLENKLQELNKRINFWVTDFYSDKHGNQWLTSNTEGLTRISADGSKLDRWTVKEGLPSNSLVRIESVDDQFLWISTISGLCRFEMETGQLMNFNHRDGLAANEFSDRTSVKTDDGRIVFGSISGFTIVNPDKLLIDSSKTEVIISDIRFMNQSIRSKEGKKTLSLPLEETKEINLPYSRNSFTIHFFTKDKDFPKYNTYNYRLLGLENDWNYLGETNHTNYTNLSPGSYTFEIKSSSKSNAGSGIPTSLVIRINPPWYLSWYAFAGYILLVFILIYLSLSVYTNRVQLKKELEISEFQALKEHELTEKKLAFFTNISHDLKTPLTLIDAPVNDLLQSKNLDMDQVNKLEIIRRNSSRLYKLITDLLDFRKLTENKLALEIAETNIQELMEEVLLAFQEECKMKSLKLEIRVLLDHTVFVDDGKVEKILWNLLSNAIKFTESGGEIFLGAEEKFRNGKSHLEFTVKDSGIGISETDQQKIFDPFYQVRTPKTNSQKGTGIGLSIVKDLVELHHGQLLADSKPGSGTTFRIILPAEKSLYSPDEIVAVKKNPLSISKANEVSDQQVPNAELNQKRYNLSKILIVEDNDDLRGYLADHFGKSYKVYQAEDGKEGLKIANEINPDLILTDVQMPNMNGYKFCKEIRSNFDTSHIPVVMLTANSDVEQQIEGLSTGADAYLTKPFDIQLLDTVLISVLDNRKKLRYKLLGLETTFEDEDKLPQKDLDFIAEVKAYIGENLANIDLNIELILENFAISRTQLNRKIKSLTGSTPNNLIKTIRLKKAYELIRQKDARVSEVAYLTGFSDPNYFTTCFKKEFGENPSQIGSE